MVCKTLCSDPDILDRLIDAHRHKVLLRMCAKKCHSLWTARTCTHSRIFLPKKVKELKIQKERHKERYTQMFYFRHPNEPQPSRLVQWPPHHPKDFHGCCATVMAKIGWKVFFQPLSLQCRPPNHLQGCRNALVTGGKIGLMPVSWGRV